MIMFLSSFYICHLSRERYEILIAVTFKNRKTTIPATLTICEQALRIASNPRLKK